MTALARKEQREAVEYDPFAGGELARVVPTTEPQREVWLADRLGEDASLAYNESVSLRLRGSLDEAALAAALQALVERRDAFRANFGPDGETLCVRKWANLAFSRFDFSSLDPAARAAALAERQRRAVDTPFALDRDTLLRAELVRLDAEEHALLLTAHHIVCDGWSWWILVRELGTLYAQVRDQAVEGLAAPASFADYALQLARQSGGVRTEDEAYWLARFADGAPVLDLPLDRPRPARRGFASKREDHLLDAELLTAIRAMGARRGASLFATLLAGFGGLLARLCGQSDVVIGIPAAGQSVDGHDDVVGHCVNLLPLRCDAAPDKPFAALLQETQAGLFDALEHQRYTFGTLLKKLRVERDPSRLPLVGVMFNIDQALDQQAGAFPGLLMEFESNPRSHENFELSVNAVQTRDGLRLECQYNTDLFDDGTVRRWLRAYESLLRGAVQQADAELGRLPLVDAQGLRELAALQPAATPFPAHAGMHELFEAQCERTPERIAVRCGQQALSYAGLEARANRIAALLRARGVHRGALVGLSVDRGVDMLAALLGILKTGAGYVPLDPAFPQERLAYMVGDAGLAALVTQREHAGRFDLRGRPVLMLDALEQELAAASPARAARESVDPEAAAYVIYTSGSTGQPKGVQVPHRAVANFIASMQHEPGIVDDDRLVAVTTLSFDIAVLELFLPLSVGAEVVIADRETVMDGERLAALLDESGATLMQATPATWRMLLDAGWTGDPDFRVLCGGEPLPPALAQALLSRCGELWNLYGPTETTVWSTCCRVHDPERGISIGRPIANTTVWILDAQRQPCPLGVPGELCIGGDGVSLGYLGRAELTADRFLADPFDKRPQAKLYRTGDRARWRSDGTLEHLGRLDFQVKVRGYRIELGEIETALAACPGVDQAIALVREDRPGDVRLVAYAVAQPDVTLDPLDLRQRLKQALPEYMVPQHVMPLERMPLLPNGKIDRKSLPSPIQPASGEMAASATALPATTDAPRNGIERRVAAAMGQVLGMPDIGVHDNFFSLGGHSLLAAQLTSRLNREFGASLSLRALFDGPTVAQLAAAISASPTQEAPRPPVLPRADQREAPLSLVQEHMAQLERINPGQLGFNTPSAHWLTGPLDHAAFEQAFADLMQRQSVLRTTMEERDGEFVQVVHERIDTGLAEIEDLSALPAEQRELALAQRIDALIATPFELVGAPLFRARLFKLEETRHALFFMTHHIVWDGWSFDLFYRDFAELYAARCEGREARLPALPVSYGDFSAWHRGFVDSVEYARQRDFWRQRLGEALADGEPAQDLSGGRGNRPLVAVEGGRTRRFRIDRSVVDGLRELGLSLDATLFMVLLAAYFVLLQRLTGRRNLIVSSPVRGRNSAEVEDLMGYFVSVLPLRVRLDPGMPFAEAVAKVREVVLESFANPDIRLEEVVRELSLRGERSALSLYQVMFTLQDIRQRVTRWGGLTHERLEVAQPGSTEDLGLSLIEDEEGVLANLFVGANALPGEDAGALCESYLAVLETALRDPLARIDALAVASPATLEPATAIPAAGTLPQPAPEPQATDENQDPRVAYLSRLWSGLLQAPAGADDNFFDLGGHSLLAMQMAAQVARDTGVRLKMLPLATLTLGQLALELPRSAPAIAPSPPARALTGARTAGKTGTAMFFGKPHRRLYGMWHGDGAANRNMLIVPPLLQEGIVSQRALWTLAEALATAGTPALRFDWYGSGDSAGDSDALSLPGLQDDLAEATAWLSSASADARIRTLALRSACLPVLAAATSAGEAVDLVLWDPVLEGAGMLSAWRRTHASQFAEVGRYRKPMPVPEKDDELLGFDVDPGFIDELSKLDLRRRALPAGSRLRLAVWQENPALNEYIAMQAAAGVDASLHVLATQDQPAWDDPNQIEKQAFPRRSVIELANLLAEARAWPR
ncbi:amino acid adenylation domain-containing protein [Pseudoxanthomonas helianthi]|uniref:Amino acid adenylation domain-containing protein n=1 Tax=Pseudoxanthomonas helianthi TaxID=1453541 RepID=A0A941AX62_9GAMM|nr:non-ribosomal peptide synthetase [Pseudoxanthomonas helianthi]MBP3985877.1 amino acid adenylation domain-containing protein [Pseudoxanthomonas helianthi]